jgi:hypothetical protein
MGAWFVSKVLPGLITSSIWAAVVWLSHRKTRKHIDTVTAAQTRAITGRDEPGGTS